MRKPLAAIPVFGLLLIVPLSTAAAAPNPSLTVSIAKKSLTAVLSADATTAACTFALFGASEKRPITRTPVKATRLADVAGGDGSVTLSAANIPALQSKGSSTRKIFFRAELTCGNEITWTEPVSLRVKTASRGRTPARWLAAVRTKLAAVKLALTRVFGTATFSDPLDFQTPDDGTGRMFVVEQGGKIWVLSSADATATKKLFLDIGSKISTGGERGLLGLAFPPRFSTKKVFYVNYTEVGTGTTVVARYAVSTSDADVADSASEARLLLVEQPFENHNGGGLAFGGDGFLYIGLGDGGSGGDPQGNGQDLKTLLGDMLRIDVESTSPGKAYGIPASNPYVGNMSGIKEEIFASGLRNPFRFSFDPPTGRLWVGDVGQGAFEEIDIIERGKNYGWNRMEGNACYPPGSSCDRSGLALPVLDYPRSDGESVTGGYVYRGSRIPSLVGLYIFGDFVSGKIWSLTLSGATGSKTELFDSGFNVSSFGVDASGEVYVVSYSDGRVYRIDPVS